MYSVAIYRQDSNIIHFPIKCTENNAMDKKGKMIIGYSELLNLDITHICNLISIKKLDIRTKPCQNHSVYIFYTYTNMDNINDKISKY